jgi:hypothetical protein
MVRTLGLLLVLALAGCCSANVKPSATSFAGQPLDLPFWMLSEPYPGAWDTVSSRHKDRIRVPKRIFEGCYKDNAEVQSFGSPSQEEWAKALDRESQVHNDCTALQIETVKYLSEALGRLRNVD